MNRYKWFVFFLFDLLAITTSFFAAFYIYYGSLNLVFVKLNQYQAILWGEILLYQIIFKAWGLYKWEWKYAGITEMMDLVRAISLNFVVLAGLDVLLQRYLVGFPLIIVLIAWGMLLLLVGGSRLLIRYSKERENKPVTKISAINVLIVGAGDAGVMIAREIGKNSRLGYKCVGFVDDNKQKQGQYMVRLPVLGYAKDIPTIVKKYQVEEIIISIPSATGQQLRTIVNYCEQSKTKFRTLPGIHELIDNTVHTDQIREVKIEDLLGREPINLEIDSISAYLTGAKILVTGAGGSIGSEICRQISVFKPLQLLVLGKGENSIYHIEMELKEKFPQLNVVPLIADIRDRKRLENIFREFAPDVVFHAAAHKHVPLMESNPQEAFLNNVIGTKNLVELADQNKVKIFVMISTDKAVNPANVMGATKRIAEMVVQAKAQQGSGTKFVSVRFGNVLDSRGSVVPLFRRQIAKGGPITVTHPEVKRYFMTIPEAVRLVIQAGSLGRGGEIFILDMGEPVKIVDLAKDMIRLSGLELGKDIEIKYVGLRPGEKLFEEILTNAEGIKATRFKRIFVAQPDHFSLAEIKEQISELKTLAEESNISALKEKIDSIVPIYKPKSTS